MKTFFKIILSVVIVALIVAIAVPLSKKLTMRVQGIREQSTIRDLYETEKSEDKNVVEPFVEKYENDEIVGFLEVTETNIKYPVTHTDNNDFYLNHGYDKKFNINGALFMDKDSLESKNRIIYGHRMSTGTMFNDLPKLLNKERAEKATIKYYDNHGAEYDYKVFSVFRVPASFDYRKVDFINDEDFRLYVKELKESSEIDLDSELNRNVEDAKSIITLSTCTYEQKNYRLVVVGFEGE